MVSSSFTLNAVHNRADQRYAPSPTQSPPSKQEHSIRHQLNRTHRLPQTTPTLCTIETCTTRYMTSSSTSSHTVMTALDTPLSSRSHTSFPKSNSTSIVLAISLSSPNLGANIPNAVSLSLTTLQTNLPLP